MSIKIMNLVWESAPYSENSLITLLALADWSNDKGESWPSVETLSKKSRQSERNCRYVLRKIENDGYIKIKPRRNDSSLYVINIPKLISEGAKIAALEVTGGQFETLGGQLEAEKVSSIAPNTSENHQQKQPSIESTSLFPLNKVGIEPKKESQGKTKKEPFCLPAWVPVFAWDAYVEMRSKKHPLTDTAKRLELQELEKLKGLGYKPELILYQSVQKCWRGLFPIKADYQAPKAPANDDTEDALTRERKREAARKVRP